MVYEVTVGTAQIQVNVTTQVLLLSNSISVSSMCIIESERNFIPLHIKSKKVKLSL
jgi:hypothetical protein